MMVSFASDKHSSLFINYSCTKFFKAGPWFGIHKISNDHFVLKNKFQPSEALAVVTQW
jgi:hypothetical protein